MGIGFRPIRGNWRTVAMPTASAATFQTWAPLDWDGARNLIEATSASTAIVGVALSYSTASFPMMFGVTGLLNNGILVAVPVDQSAVFETNVATNVAASSLSFGQSWNITKSANNLRIDTASAASVLAEIVSYGLVDSVRSTVEGVFVTNRRAYSSASSVVIF